MSMYSLFPKEGSTATVMEDNPPSHRSGVFDPSAASAIFDRVPGTAIFDDQICCTAANDSLAEMLHLSISEIIGKRPDQILGAPALRIMPAFLRVQRTGRPIRAIELNAVLSPALGRRDWMLDVIPAEPIGEMPRQIALVILEARSFFGLRRGLKRDLRELGNTSAEFTRDGSLDQRLRQDDVMFRNAMNQANCSRSLRVQAEEFWAAAWYRRTALNSMNTCAKRGVGGNGAGLRHASGSTRAVAHSSNNAPSRRECQVLQLLSNGKTNKEIAETLGLSVRTVETYRARLMAKLGLRNAADAVHYAIRSRLVTI